MIAIAFPLAGLVAALALVLTVRAHWGQIGRAIRGPRNPL